MVLPAVQALVDNVDTDDAAIKARCELAIQLATSLDDAVQNGENNVLAALSKELRSAISDVASVESKKQQFVSTIFE